MIALVRIRNALVFAIMLLGLSMRRVAVTAFSSSSSCQRMTAVRRRSGPPPVMTRLRSSWSGDDDGGDDSFVDKSGRRIRSGSRATQPANDGWGDNDDLLQPRRRGTTPRTPTNTGGGSSSSWEDFDPWDDNTDAARDRGSPTRSSSSQRQTQRPSSRRDNNRDFGGRDNRRRRDDDVGDRPRRSFDGSRGGARNSRESKKPFNKNKDDDKGTRSINMNSLEGAGFVHLYGLSSVLNALSANRRDINMDLEKTMGDGTVDDPRFKTMNDSFDPDFDDDDDFGTAVAAPKADVKPEAQFRSYLFVQDRSGGGSRKGSKATAAQEVMELAESLNVPIAYVDKGILNTLSGNRPHQGFVLRCGKMNFQGLSRIPTPDEADAPSLWLVLDEVVDPQNLGALLRSAYFLGGGTSNNKPKMGVLVCSKNSAPPSPVVSASSAGALELLEVHSTTNLPRTLQQAREDGFRIIGASSSIPTTTNENETDEGPSLYDLQDLPAPGVDGDDRPVILILGSEGHGLRTLVAKACTEFVRIPSGICSTDMNSKDDDDTSEAGVDSLNVSVTGGIMLWHLLHGRSK